MIDIYNWLQYYCFEKGYIFIGETPYGINVNLDDNKEGETYVFYNIIANGTIQSADDYNKNLLVTDTAEIGVFERCIKEDEGENYYPIIKSVKTKAITLYRDLLNDCPDLNPATFETAVDSKDSNNVVCKLTLPYPELISTCSDLEDKTDYEKGYEVGYADGYADGKQS